MSTEKRNIRITFYIRKLNPTQACSTTSKHELLTIFETLKEFQNITFRHKTRIFTGPKKLTYRHCNFLNILQYERKDLYGPIFPFWIHSWGQNPFEVICHKEIFCITLNLKTWTCNLLISCPEFSCLWNQYRTKTCKTSTLFQQVKQTRKQILLIDTN